jgi:sterol desaturase/sphingolipid hydroxylase (fatty acid hydroxylase superfamily)
VLIFEVLLNATSMFNHSNVRMPLWLDRVLRWLVVTPDMHRVHHSWYRHETNSNFGFNQPWWDRLMGTYRDQPADGHIAMTIGLTELRDAQKTERLHWMLWLPFTKSLGADPPSGAAPNGHGDSEVSGGNPTLQQPDSLTGAPESGGSR